MTEKRLICPSCKYPMRILSETNDSYLCYCAECKIDREVIKYSIKQLKRDIERNKAIDKKLIIDLMERVVNENEQLKKENQGIQDKVMRLLDYVELKQCVTRTEIKKWWNGDVE